MYWGTNEHQARWGGCTHKRCDCGLAVEKHWLKCVKCRDKADLEKYNAREFKEHDGEFLYSEVLDKYFPSAEDFLEEIAESHVERDNGIVKLEPKRLEAADMRLVICEPNIARYIEEDHWCDDLPEDGELPDELKALVDKVNEYIKDKQPILSWSPGKYRTTITQVE